MWTLTSGFVAMSGHGVIDDLDKHRTILDEINRRLNEHGIQHVTFQLEPRALHQITLERRDSAGGAGKDRPGQAR